MNATHDNGLVHAFQSHSKQEESGDLDIAWKVDKYSAKSCDLCLEVVLSEGRRYCQSSCCLQILHGVADVSVLWWLDGSAQNI